MKARIYMDVNFLVHVLQGAEGPFGLDAQTALRNVARGHAGSHVAVCCSSWQLSVLKNTLEKLGLGHLFESFVDAFIEVVDATGGIEDAVRVSNEDFRALETEAHLTRQAPDGEDLGHLKSMLRMKIDVFVTDDSLFAEDAKKAGIDVIKTSKFIRLANSWKLDVRGQNYLKVA